MEKNDSSETGELLPKSSSFDPDMSRYLSRSELKSLNHQDDGLSFEADSKNPLTTSQDSQRSASTTYSSYTPYGARRSKVENYGMKYRFACRFNEDDNREEVIIIDSNTNKTGQELDVEKEGFIFQVAFHCANSSSNAQQLMHNVSHALQHEFLGHSSILDKLYQDIIEKFLRNEQRITALQKMVMSTDVADSAGEEEIKALRGHLESLSDEKSSDAVHVNVVSDKLAPIIEREQILICSEVFENIRKVTKDKRKSVNADLQKLQKAKEILGKPELIPNGEREAIIEENKLFNNIIVQKKREKRDDIVNNIHKQYRNPDSITDEMLKAQNQKLCEEIQDLRASDNLSLPRDIMILLDNAEYQSGDVIRAFTSNESSTTPYCTRSKYQMDYLLRGDIPVIKTVEELEQEIAELTMAVNYMHNSLEKNQTNVTGNKKKAKRITDETSVMTQDGDDLDIINYHIDDNLITDFIVKTHRRPNVYGQNSGKQDDHVTAYVALVQSFVNSLMPIYKPSNVISYVSEQLGLILGSEDESFKTIKEKFPEKNFENLDNNRRNFVNSLPESVSKEDKAFINYHIKKDDIKFVNDTICEMVNIYLTAVNSQQYATFKQGGENAVESPAIHYISSLNSICINEGLNTIIESKLEGLRGTEKVDSITYLKNLKVHLATKLDDDKKALPHELKFLKPNDIVLSTLDSENIASITQGLSKSIYDIFDLSYDPITRIEDLEDYPDPKDKAIFMKSVCNNLIERHFKFVGVLSGPLLYKLNEKNSIESDIYSELANSFLNNFFEDPNFKNLFSIKINGAPGTEQDFNAAKEALKNNLVNIMKDRSQPVQDPFSKKSHNGQEEDEYPSPGFSRKRPSVKDDSLLPFDVSQLKPNEKDIPDIG